MTNLFKNLYQYRELLKTSVKKEIRGKYKESITSSEWKNLPIIPVHKCPVL